VGVLKWGKFLLKHITRFQQYIIKGTCLELRQDIWSPITEPQGSALRGKYYYILELHPSRPIISGPDMGNCHDNFYGNYAPIISCTIVYTYALLYAIPQTLCPFFSSDLLLSCIHDSSMPFSYYVATTHICEGNQAMSMGTPP
jgi:hypothetical protein